MAKGFKHGAGGVSALNFKIVGGAIQPGNPKENTLWVNTQTEISGWVVSAEEPGEPAGGMVWIEVGSVSPAPFKALKKDSVYVHPISCRQYQGGAWTNVDAYLYNGSEWARFSSAIVWIYDNGVTPFLWNGRGTDTDSALVMSVIHHDFSGSYRSAGWKFSTEAVTIPSGASVMKMTYSTSGGFASLTTRVFGFRTSAYSGGGYYDFEAGTDKFAAYVSMGAGTDVTVSVPITQAMEGNSYYVAVLAYTGNTEINATVTISKIWIE